MKISKLCIFLLGLTMFTSCSKSLLNKSDMVQLSQYADGILDFSTEYSAAPGPWSSFVVLGAPDTYPEYGDKQTAWASKTSDGADEFLAVAFDTAQHVNQIDIYETYNPGAVTLVELRNTDNGSWVPVYNTSVEKNLPKKARILKIDIPQTAFTIDAVRITIASRKVKGWNEIDAIRIFGEYERD